jgi:hypothetical protein
MAKQQTAIEWLEAAGVDCTLLRLKLTQIRESHAAKEYTRDGKKVRVEAAKPAPGVRESVVRNFVNQAAVVDALVKEIVDEEDAAAPVGVS